MLALMGGITEWHTQPCLPLDLCITCFYKLTLFWGKPAHVRGLKAHRWACMTIFACSGKLSPSLASGTIFLGTASHRAHCQLRSLSCALSPPSACERGWSLTSFLSQLPACSEAFTQAGGWAFVCSSSPPLCPSARDLCICRARY